MLQFYLSLSQIILSSHFQKSNRYSIKTHFLIQTLKNKDCNAHDSEIDMVASILLQEKILNNFYIPKPWAVHGYTIGLSGP